MVRLAQRVAAGKRDIKPLLPPVFHLETPRVEDRGRVGAGRAEVGVAETPEGVGALMALLGGTQGAIVPVLGRGVILELALRLTREVVELPPPGELGEPGVHVAEDRVGIGVFLPPVVREALHEPRVRHVGAVREFGRKLLESLDRGNVVPFSV